MLPVVRRRIRFLLPSSLMMILALAGSATVVSHPVRAASPLELGLDANSTSQTDVSVTTSALQSRNFRVGAVINASNTNQLSGVYGWEFAIEYNASAFVPQGEPGGSPYYPDGAQNTVLFGSQFGPGTVNWNALVSAYEAYGGFGQTGRTLVGCRPAGPSGKLIVFLTLIAPTPAVTISARTLLASVNFELINKPSSAQIFRISDVAFADMKGQAISGVVAGRDVSEIVTNDPPHSVFTVAPAASAGPFAFTFNATGSNDSDDSIPNPAGYFWDFGDGNQDLGVTGPIVTHDYGIDGTYTVTLRIKDLAGATGAARDLAGNWISDSQPSHASMTIGPVQIANALTSSPFTPTMIDAFTFSPSSPTVGEIMLFTLNGPLAVANCWDFGDGSTGEGSPVWHVYNRLGNYTVTLTTVSAYGGATNSSKTIQVRGPNLALAHLAWTRLLSSATPPSELTTSGHPYSEPPTSVSVGPAAVYLTYGSEVRSYDFLGNLAWTRQTGGRALDVAVGSKALYVVGGGNYASSRAFVEKYDFDGNLVWTRQFLGIDTGGAWASTVAVDPAGVYVAGGTNSDYAFATKFDTRGNQQWMRKFVNTESNSQTWIPRPCTPNQEETSISVAPRGIYTVGFASCFSSKGCPLKAQLVATSRDGKGLWTKDVSFVGPGPVLSVGPSGIYLVGPGLVFKYDFNGNELWRKEFSCAASGFECDDPISVSAGPEGVYVVGTRWPEFWLCWPFTLQCIFNSWYNSVTYLDSSGNEVWTLHFPGDLNNYPVGISASSQGVFVVGSSFVSKVAVP